MCSKIKIQQQIFEPGTIIDVKISPTNTIQLRWGITYNDDELTRYNARLETIVNSTYWDDIKNNRCIVETNGFYENNTYFSPKHYTKLGLLGLYLPNNGFLIITIPACSYISQYHHRQPIIIYEPDYPLYLRKGIISKFMLLNSNKIKITS